MPAAPHRERDWENGLFSPQKKGWGVGEALTMLLPHPGSSGAEVCVGTVSAEGSLHLAARSRRTGTNARAFGTAVTILTAPGRGREISVSGRASAAPQAVPAPSRGVRGSHRRDFHPLRLHAALTLTHLEKQQIKQEGSFSLCKLPNCDKPCLLLAAVRPCWGWDLLSK